MSHFQAAYKELSLRNSSYRVQFAGIYSVIDDITIATVVVAVPVAERDLHILLLARCLSLTQPLVGLLAVQAEPRAEGMDVDVLEQ